MCLFLKLNSPLRISLDSSPCASCLVSHTSAMLLARYLVAMLKASTIFLQLRCKAWSGFNPLLSYIFSLFHIQPVIFPRGAHAGGAHVGRPPPLLRGVDGLGSDVLGGRKLERWMERLLRKATGRLARFPEVFEPVAYDAAW